VPGTGLLSNLEQYCQEHFRDQGATRVSGLQQIDRGWEADVYAFDLEGSSARLELILRGYPGDVGLEKSAREVDGMRRLYQAGYPVPQIYAYEPDPVLLGYPFVMMQRISGELLWDQVFHGPVAERAGHREHFCRLMVQLHTLDWRILVDDPSPVISGGAYQFFDGWLAEMDFAAQQYMPELAGNLDWFRYHRNDLPCDQPAIIHYDFHPQNVLLQPDGQAFVIDWTQISLSDLRFDLGWTLVLIGSIVGMEARQAILDSYQVQLSAVLGESLAEQRLAELEIFEACACLRRVGSVVISFQAGAGKLGMRPGAEAMMRQQLAGVRSAYQRLVDITDQRAIVFEDMLDSREYATTESHSRSALDPVARI
jgi:aminoglycoside phosphotransferase (APT) family kinase protein